MCRSSCGKKWKRPWRSLKRLTLQKELRVLHLGYLLLSPLRNPKLQRRFVCALICVWPTPQYGVSATITPTMDDIITELNGATVFSKLDLNSGYHQLEIEPSSRYITTFTTHVGLFRYRRLNFGISSAAEVFQEAIRRVINSVPGDLNISDDVIVYGKDSAQHDKAPRGVLDQLLKNGLTLTKTNVSSIKQVWNSSGISSRKMACQQIPKRRLPSRKPTLQGTCLNCAASWEWPVTVLDSFLTSRPSQNH